MALCFLAAPDPGFGAGQGKELPRDPEAKAFLKQVLEADPGWDNGFPGFEADLEVFWEGKTHRGKVAVREKGKTAVTISNSGSDAESWAREKIESIVASAYREDFEVKYAKLGVTFGPDDLNPLGQLVLVHGEPFETRYRIKDNEIRRIRRSNEKSLVTIDILHLERDSQGRKIAQTFATQHFDSQTRELRKTETVRESKIVIGGYLLPESYLEIANVDGGPRMRSIRFKNHRVRGAAGKGTE